MSPKMARLVVDVCNELPFVNWDRFIDLSSTVLVFGWIDRKQDSYKDFVTVEVNSKGQLEYTTSSAEYSEEISEIYMAYGRLPRGVHESCQRVEDNELLSGVKHFIKIKRF
jgi:hypothetical protein